MTSSPASPNEKEFSSQPTCYSNASSSTIRSKITLTSLRHAASSFGLLLSKRKPNIDVEQQSEPEITVDDDASIFPAGGPEPYKTKVRTRKCTPFPKLSGFQSSYQSSR
jgi:hypothetical protein